MFFPEECLISATGILCLGVNELNHLFFYFVRAEIVSGEIEISMLAGVFEAALLLVVICDAPSQVTAAQRFFVRNI